MKVLSIGNSFSQDAQRYLHQIALNEGESLKTANLYIGGCSLESHYQHMKDNLEAYSLEINGESTGRLVSISQAIESDLWDIVTLQQASPYSIDVDSFYPYIKELSNFIRAHAPKAKIYIHETWAYEAGSDMLKNLGFETSMAMYIKLHDAYLKVANDLSADGIIPCGTAMIHASQQNIGSVHRDTYHASYGLGRYILAMTWFKTLYHRMATKPFNALDEFVSEEQKQIVNYIVKSL